MQYRKLGPYQVNQSVARGGMGEIFRSVDERGRVVALKIILKEHQGDAAFRELFIREAQVTFELDHPNIVKAYHFQNIGNQLVLAMEFLDGINLREVLREARLRHFKIPIVIAVAIMDRVLHGLYYAHHKRNAEGQPLGIVHRDLNPTNIFLTRSGQVKILDFGISKSNLERSPASAKDEIRGKIAYLSPEQIRNSEIDARSDIFSAAVLLWELLTGEALFLRSTFQEAAEEVLKGNYKPIRDLRSDVTEELDRVLTKAMSLVPKDRYRNTKEFALALRLALPAAKIALVSEQDVATFLKALMPRELTPQDPEFLSDYAWMLSLLPGQEKKAVEMAKTTARSQPSSTKVKWNLMRTFVSTGERREALDLLKEMSHRDEFPVQSIMELLGIRRPPVIPFLKRGHMLNHVLGYARHRVLGPRANEISAL